MVEIHPAAGDQPARGGDLLALLPVRDGPHVLGMRRDAERQAAQDGGVAGHGCRRVQVVHVQPGDPGRQLGREDQAWPSRRPRLARGVAARGPRARRAAAARTHVAGRPPPGRASTRQRLLVEILRQVADRRADLPGAARAPGRRSDGAGRRSRSRQAQPLQRQDLLGDEGLRQARIALDQDGDAAGQGVTRTRLRAQLGQSRGAGRATARPAG